MRSSPHPPELVERVAADLRDAWYTSDNWTEVARYALDLAERAAREVIDGMLCGTDEAIRRAVEGV